MGQRNSKPAEVSTIVDTQPEVVLTSQQQVEQTKSDEDIPLLRYTAKVKKLCGSVPGTRDGLLSTATLFRPEIIVIDQQGNVIVNDVRHSNMRKIDLKNRIVSPFCSVTHRGYRAMTKTSSGEVLFYNNNIVCDTEGTLLLTQPDIICMCVDETNDNILYCTKSGVHAQHNGLIHEYTSFGTQARNMTVDQDKNIFIIDINGVIYKIVEYDSAPRVSEFAGQRKKKGIRDGSPGMFCRPWGIVYHKEAKCLYVTDLDKIRKVSMDGFIRTIYGNDTTNYVPKHDFHGMAINHKGTLFVCDTMHDSIVTVQLPWEVIKLVWVAWYKNQENDGCLLARLPKDIIREILCQLLIDV